VATTASLKSARETSVDKYVALDALAGVVRAIIADCPGAYDSLNPLAGLNGDDISVSHLQASDWDLYMELWPTREDHADVDDDPEFQAAEKRARTLEAKLLIELARSRDELIEHAAMELAALERYGRAVEGGDDA
jgi:hypothetical protein